MTKSFEEWLVELAKNENFSVVDRLPDFLHSQYAKVHDAAGERDRLTYYIQQNAPRGIFTKVMLEVIANSA